MTQGKRNDLQAAVNDAIAAAAIASPNGAAAAGGAAALAIGAHLGKSFAKPLLDALKTPDDRLNEWIAEERAHDIEAVRARLEPKLEQLLESAKDTQGMVTDIVAIFAAHHRARSHTADPKKKRLLMGALVNAFDPETYTAGMTFTLFGILDGLDYGDVFVLSGYKDDAPGLRDEFRFNGSAVTRERRSAARWHVKRLWDAQLLYWTAPNGGPEANFEIHQMVRTEVGDRLLRLIGPEALREAEGL